MLTVSVATDAASSAAVLDFLRSIARDFGRALLLGFFGPGVPAVPVSVQPASSTLVLVHVHADAFHPAALRILRGMCEWGRLARGLPLQWLGAAGQAGAAISSGDAPSALVSAAPMAFSLVRPPFVGFGEQVVVLLNLTAPADDAQIALIEAGFETWTALMQGGLPPEDCMPGESTVGAAQGMRIGSTTYQWFVEGVIAHEACIDLLANFLEAHSFDLRIGSVEIEA